MDRQGIADQCDRTVDALTDYRRRDVDTLLHRQDVVVVLVAHRAVETHFGRVFVLAQKHLPEVTRLLCVEDAVREQERRVTVSLERFEWIGVVAHLREEKEFACHGIAPVALRSIHTFNAMHGPACNGSIGPVRMRDKRARSRQ